MARRQVRQRTWMISRIPSPGSPSSAPSSPRDEREAGWGGGKGEGSDGSGRTTELTRLNRREHLSRGFTSKAVLGVDWVPPGAS